MNDKTDFAPKEYLLPVKKFLFSTRYQFFLSTKAPFHQQVLSLPATENNNLSEHANPIFPWPRQKHISSTSKTTKA